MKIVISSVIAAVSILLGFSTEDQMISELALGITIFACLYLIREINYERIDKIN